MRHFRLLTVIVGLLFLLVSAVSAQDGPPKAAVHEVTDTYFGQKIVDPYRWMEDSKSAETTAWMKAQADYTRGYLERLSMRAELLKREAVMALRLPRTETASLARAAFSAAYEEV